MDEWAGGRMDGWMGGRVDGWMDGLLKFRSILDFHSGLKEPRTTAPSAQPL